MSDEKVGYGKPPAATRFKPGTSGNPKGRSKRQASTLVSVIRDMKSASVTYSENGHERIATHQELLSRQMLTQAAKGNLTAIDAVFRQIRKELRQGNSQPPRVEIINALPSFLGPNDEKSTVKPSAPAKAPSPPQGRD